MAALPPTGEKAQATLHAEVNVVESAEKTASTLAYLADAADWMGINDDDMDTRASFYTIYIDPNRNVVGVQQHRNEAARFAQAMAKPSDHEAMEQAWDDLRVAFAMLGTPDPATVGERGTRAAPG